MADQVMLDAGDVDKDVAFGELQLSFQEREVLQLYDRLEELKLEASYLKAMQSFATGMSNQKFCIETAKFSQSRYP